MQSSPVRVLLPNPKNLLGRSKCKVHFRVIFLFKLFNFSVASLYWDILYFTVRKVKMGLEPPTGCSMSSVITNKIKIESVRHHFSSFQSKLSSGWHALRKVRFIPHLPANGSLTQQSLAYVHASTRYIQQVSGLLKVGVTTLRSSSSSYEVVQGMWKCSMRYNFSLTLDMH